MTTQIPLFGWEGNARDFTLAMAFDIPALGYMAGQAVTIRATARCDCDAVFVLEDGSLARLQLWDAGSIRKQDAIGSVTFVPRHTVRVVGRVLSQVAEHGLAEPLPPFAEDFARARVLVRL